MGKKYAVIITETTKVDVYANDETEALETVEEAYLNGEFTHDITLFGGDWGDCSQRYDLEVI